MFQCLFQNGDDLHIAPSFFKILKAFSYLKMYTNWTIHCERHFIISYRDSLYYLQIILRHITTSVISVAGIVYHSEAPVFTPVYCGTRVAQSVVFCVVCSPLFVILSLSFGRCPSSNCGFWLPLWYLQNFLNEYMKLYLNCI